MNFLPHLAYLEKNTSFQDFHSHFLDLKDHLLLCEILGLVEMHLWHPLPCEVSYILHQGAEKHFLDEVMNSLSYETSKLFEEQLLPQSFYFVSDMSNQGLYSLFLGKMDYQYLSDIVLHFEIV